MVGVGRRRRKLEDEEPITYKAQFYLIPKSDISTTEQPDPKMRCCWDNTLNYCDFNLDSNDDDRGKEDHLPSECKDENGKASCSARMYLDFEVEPMSGGGMSGVFQSKDGSYVSVDLALDPEVEKFPEINFTLKPAKGEQMYMLLVSNCAHVEQEGLDNRANYLEWDEMILTWVLVEGGNLGEMGGLIWFYGICFTVYFLLGVQWVRKSIQFEGQLLGLQKAVSYLVYGECLFTFVAMIYYVHINNTDVDYDILYSGTFAALQEWNFWTLLVAVAHLASIFACQVVVTLAADGKWLIQHSMRKSTKVFLVVLAGLWAMYLLLYNLVSPEFRMFWAVSSGLLWITWLLISVRNSLRHIKSLTVGDSNDNISVAHPGSKRGDMLTAKRGLFRKMCFLMATYPVVFMVTMILDTSANKTEWGIPWIGYVLTDIYIFVILLQASYMWMPHPAVDYVPYAPVGTEDDTFDGDFGQGGIEMGETSGS